MMCGLCDELLFLIYVGDGDDGAVSLYPIAHWKSGLVNIFGAGAIAQLVRAADS